MKADNFLGSSTSYKDAKAVILPVPYEGTVTYGKGTANGPKAIIEASRHMELYDEEIGINTAEKIGISTLKELNVKKDKPEAMLEKVKKAVKIVADDKKMPVILGGEHSISSAPVEILKERYNNLSVLQLDAHADLRNRYNGTIYSHACIMHRILDLDVPFVQVGIRSVCEEDTRVIKRKKIPVFWAKDIYNNNNWFDKAISKLSDNVYVTIDLDVFDPSIMPSTGTPEPGGLTWYNVINFLKEVAKQKNIVGFDVVELAPNKDNIAPDFMAARLVYKMVGYVFSM